MPKLKSSRGAAKRFKITATGKVSHHKGYKSHLLGHKSRARKRRLRQASCLTKVQGKNVKRLIPFK